MKKIVPFTLVSLLLAVTACSRARQEVTPPPPTTPAPAITPAEPSPPPTSTPAAPAAPTPSSSQINARTIAMESGNLFFKPTTLTLKENEPVTINFQNKGTHTFTIDELDVNVRLSGSKGSVTFTPNKKGTFQYYCAIPGHREAGMWGTLTVE